MDNAQVPLGWSCFIYFLLFFLEYTALSHTPTDYLEAHVKKQAVGLY